MADRTVSVKLRLDSSEYTSGLVKAAAQTKGLASDVQKSVDRDLPPVLKRSGERGGGLLAEGFRSGFVRNSPLIAAAIGAGLAAGAPLALAGAGVLFGGIGALAAAQTTAVRDSWSQLGRDIRDGAVQDASVLVPVYVEMADKIGAAFERMRPEIRDAFEASAPLIDKFTDGLTNAAENALPGLVRAVERGGPVIDGLASLMEDVGTGLSDFFDAMSDNSEASGEALEALGDILAEALPLLGELLGTGAEIAADVLPPLADALGVVTDIARELGPVLPAIVTGFVAMKVASSVAGGVSALAASLGSFSLASAGAATGAGAMARALPMIALATAGLSVQQRENTDRVQRYTEALQKGGAAAAAVRAEVENQTNSGLWTRFKQAFTLDDEHDIEEDYAKAEAAVEGVGGAAETAAPSVEELRRASLDAAAALTDVPGVATSAGSAVAFLGDTANMSEDEITDAANAVVAWRAEVATIATAFVEPLNVYRTLLEAKSTEERKAAQAVADNTHASSDSWRDYVDTTKVTLDDLATKLEEQIVNQENWRSNIVGITQRGGAEVGQAFLDMGVEGADLAAQMANATDAEFRRMADLMIRDAEFGGQGAVGKMQTAMRVMEIVGRDGAAATASGIAAQLGIGVAEVARIASEYGVNLAVGVNPILGALGRRQLAITAARNGQRTVGGYAEGGYTGPGGKYDPAGIVHAGEYVFTQEQVKRLGIDRLEAIAENGYARGGFVTPKDVPKPSGTAPYGVPISTAGDATMQKGYDEVSAFVQQNMEPPPSASGGSSTGLLPIMAAARQYVMDTYGIRNIGGFARRNIAGTRTLSDHALGKAIDIMTTNGPLGWRIANDFATGYASKKFRAENVIWQQSISSRGGPFRGMADRGSPTQNHRDHVHVDTYQTGTPYVPKDGLAYLHEGEAVVPKHINTKSREFSGGGGSGGGGTAVAVSIQGAQIVGTLDLGGGLEARIDGRIVDALTSVTDRGRFNG